MVREKGLGVKGLESKEGGMGSGLRMVGQGSVMAIAIIFQAAPPLFIGLGREGISEENKHTDNIRHRYVLTHLLGTRCPAS
jgi:hypothetical protein